MSRTLGGPLRTYHSNPYTLRNDSSESCRGRTDAVHLHVVGVAVDAAFVIDHERFGGLGPEDGGQPGCRLADVGGRE